MIVTESQPRTRVAVVFGGASTEHGVSCLTAAGVVGALDPQRYEVVGVGITATGRWALVDPAEVVALEVVDGRLPAVAEEGAGEIGEALTRLGRVDVAIAVLHGPFGEDGTIQGLFEMTGVRYVGAGVLASAVGMDKHFMKLVLAASGLPVGPFVSIPPAPWARDRVAILEAVNALRFPVFVKPARGGSSVGISKVDDPAGLEAAILAAQVHDPKVIVEQGFVGARELECGVLADPAGGPPQASRLAEIRMLNASGFYDFDAKYLPEEQVALDVPAEVDDDLAARVQALAVQAFEAIDCEGLARVDVFVTAEGRVVINEINTMPGFTPHSMFPRMWAATGVDYPELLDRLITLALQRPIGLR